MQSRAMDFIVTLPSCRSTYFARSQRDRLVFEHVDGAHAQCLKDESKMLESLCLGLDIDQAKLFFCVVPVTLTLLLENI